MKTGRIIAVILCLLMLFASVDALAYHVDYYGVITAEDSEKVFNSGECPSRAASRNGGKHHYVLSSIKNTSCTKKGSMNYICTFCEKSASKSIAALGHDWATLSRVEPTCTEAGYEIVYCKRCGEQQEKKLDPLGHKWGSWQVTEPATCTQEGKQVRKCKRCGTPKYEKIPALGHDWTDWYIAKVATPEDDGYYQRDCNRCGIYEQEPYSVEDEPVSERGIEAVMYKDGYDNGTYSVYVGAVNTGKEDYTSWEVWIARRNSEYWDDHSICNDPLSGGIMSGEIFKITPTEYEMNTTHVIELVGLAVGHYADGTEVLSEGAELTIDLTGTDDPQPGSEGALLITATVTDADIENRKMSYGYTVKNVGKDPVHLLRITAKDDADIMRYFINLKDINWDVTLQPGEETSIAYMGILFKESEPECGYVDMFFHATGEREDGTGVESNTAECYYEFAGQPAEETAIQLSAVAYSVIGDECLVDLTVFNIGIYDVSDWQIVLMNDDMSNNRTWTPNSVFNHIEALNSMDGLTAFGTYPFAIATPDEIASKSKTVYAVAIGFEDKNGVKVPVKSNTVDILFNFIDPPAPPVTESKPALKLEVVQTSPAKTEYGEELVTYDFKVTNTGSEDMSDVRILQLVNTGKGEYKNNPMTSCLKASEQYDGTGSLTLSFQNADEKLNEHVVFTAFAITEDGHSIFSNDISFDYQLNTNIWEPPVEEITLYKEITSFYMNGSYYEPYEEIKYRITVTNTGEVEENDIEVCDELNMFFGGTDYLGTIEKLYPNQSEVFEFSYWVRLDDVPNGEIVNTAHANWIESAAGGNRVSYSNRVVAPCGEHIPPKYDVSLHKEAITKPQGAYFEENDEIYYRLTITNDSDFEFSSVYIDDSLAGLVAGPFVLKAHESKDFIYKYTVTWQNCHVDGFVENQARAICVEQRNEYEIYSNVVRLPASYPHDEPHLMIFMYETSTRTKDDCYMRGDVIDYEVVVANDGNVDLISVSVDSHRAMNDEDPFLGVITYLAKNDVAYIQTSTNVTDDDVDNHGYVLNYATAETWYEDQYVFAFSPDVISPLIDGVPPHKPEPKPDYCKLTLISVQDGCEVYEQHYCGEHYAAVAPAYAAVKAAKNDEELLHAWGDVCTAWEDEVNALYRTMSKTLGAKGGVAVAADKALFYAYIKSEAELMLAEMPGEEIAILEKLSVIMADKCSELCYEINAAPELRPDSYVYGSYVNKLEPVDALETCKTEPMLIETPDVLYSVIFCGKHKAARDMLGDVAAMGDNDSRIEAFGYAQRAWINLLNTQVNEEYKEADPSVKPLVAASRMNYGNYLIEHQKLLNIIYRTTPVTAAEVFMHETMTTVMSKCE